MTPRITVDGHVGTVGLRIRQWLAGRSDIEVLTLDDERRKDTAARRAEIAAADLAVLCLPDDAAREAAGWAAASDTLVIDASTAHRVADGWVYGLPELAPAQRESIRGSSRVSNPGCYPSAFLLLVRPLLDAGVISSELPAIVHAISGYSGGGRGKIEQWEDPALGLLGLRYDAPYALESLHKHIPEMVRYSGLQSEPQFLPSVAAFACGMRLQVPLHRDQLPDGQSGKLIWEVLAERYRGEPFVRVVPIAEPLDADERSFDPQVCNDTNRIELHVLPHASGHVLLMATLDNLGKGAAGVAIQCLNLMLGLPETAGLSR